MVDVILPNGLITGRVGPNRAGLATNPSPRMGFDSELVVNHLHGKAYQQAYDGNMFYAYSSLQTLSVVGTAMTGLILWNSSLTKNLILNRCHVQVPVTSASMTGIALAAGTAGAQTTAPTTTTAATKTGSTMFSGAGVGLAYNIATTLATLVVWPFAHNTAAIATTGVDAINYDFEGMFVVPPSTVVCLAALGAGSAASAVTSSISWEESPI